ncbi:restriction endonuclease [Patescibacteria group bacterium]|nr:restriction endonuclease [Patescibacteria group bacterium]
MYVIKASGEKVKFNSSKIRKTCLRAGAPKDVCRKVEQLVKDQVREGMSTQEILKITLEHLEKYSPLTSIRYGLKRAIFGLGPTGFVFEKFVAYLFQAYGFSAYCPPILKGRCVEQEVDVIAIKKRKGSQKKSQQKYLIECKYRNTAGLKVDLQDALCLWARFKDLEKENFTQPWLVSNAKFTKAAIQYGRCQGIKLLGWRYPSRQSLNALIEKKKLYPITILKEVSGKLAQNFFNQDVIILSHLCSSHINNLSSRVGISSGKMKRIVEAAQLILKS